ncbi:MAG TPA: hypothetical protein PLJ47_11035, partial [Candidatus Hydrogenedentes bacterium]|nr:hypothetical protein [Candidatus Hydrogenedentota bacterium]
MAAQSLSLAQTVRRYAASRRRRVGALACVRAAWLAIAALLALVYIDVLVQLGPQARLYLLGIAALGLAGIAVITYRRHARAQSEQRLVARLLEQGDSNLGNDLINALEFEELLARDAPLTASKPLMRRGVSLASEKAAHVTHTEILAPPSLRRESRFVMLGMATLAVSAVVFAGVFQAVLPRYLLCFSCLVC